MQAYHQRKMLIEEHKVNYINLMKTGSHVTWPATHSVTKSGSEMCNIPTLIRVSPLSFDTIHFVSKIINLQYLTKCFPLQTE